MTPKFSHGVLESKLKDIFTKGQVKDIDVIEELKKNLGQYAHLDPLTVDWNSFKTFWPPRLLEAFKADNLACFFGSGLSIPSGLPNWQSLLKDNFGLDDKFTADNELQNDPLTLAEIASNFSGAENIQNLLRSKFGSASTMPSSMHALLALMQVPIYITTNYDNLFEKIWKEIHPSNDLHVILNDADLAVHFNRAHLSNPPKKESYLFKIHGCVDKGDEHLILTRRDYRFHYRSNKGFFDTIIDVLNSLHVLFLGFSHKDPEVTRLVEEAIWKYEESKNKTQKTGKPNLYSLQFDMRSHTPEIFAAKGIVALNPPPNLFERDPRTYGLNLALAELQLAALNGLGSKKSLNGDLTIVATELNKILGDGLTNLEKYGPKALSCLKAMSTDFSWLSALLSDLGDLANQGVYLCDEHGHVLEYETPPNISKASYQITKALNERSYFRMAKTYRTAFVSDSDKSLFNGYSTFFLCFPVLQKGKFNGLLFSACQIGNWATPIQLAQPIWNKDYSFILVDSNGVCLVPPNEEFGPVKPSLTTTPAIATEGYKFEKLLLFSRKDKLISRIMENVVPLEQDDDILILASDIRYYSILTEIDKSRWKLGIATAIFSKHV